MSGLGVVRAGKHMWTWTRLARTALTFVYTLIRRSPSPGAADTQSLHNEVGDAFGIVQGEYRAASAVAGVIGGDGDDVGVGSGEWHPVHSRKPANLDLGDRSGLIAFNDDEVAGLKAADHIIERRLRRAAQLAHHGPAFGRNDGHLDGAGTAMARAIGLGVVDLEAVVGVLDSRHSEAAAGELGDQARYQRGLAGVLPAGNADDRRCALRRTHEIARASSSRRLASSSGVLALKNGSRSTPPIRTSGNGTGTVPWRSVQASTLRTPTASCASRSSASATGHRPITGCSSPDDWASAMAPGRSSRT